MEPKFPLRRRQPGKPDVLSEQFLKIAHTSL
jgi:hypothetical protein